MIDLLQFKIGTMSGGDFERFIRRLLPRTSKNFENLKATYNFKGKETKGPVDLFSYKPTSNSYAAVICTTQTEKVRDKVMLDLAKLSSESCFIRDQIDEVIICLSTPVRSEEIIYRNACAENGWAVEIHSLDTLAYLANEQPDIANDLCAREIQEIRNRPLSSQDTHKFVGPEVIQKVTNVGQIERFYDCGKRVKEIRENLSISASRFIELVDFPSEKYLNSVELTQYEISSNRIRSICDTTGLSERWLRHGEGKKYAIDGIPTWGGENLENIRALNPQSLYFLVNVKTMSLVLLVHIKALHWRIFSFSFNLDFWNWIGDEHEIPRIYSLLRSFAKDFGSTPVGRIISDTQFNEIISGDIHPSVFLKTTDSFASNWFDDLQDIDHVYPIAKNYANWYGDWFVKIQSYFQKTIIKVEKQK
jgi:hypothetical protein